MIWQNTASDNGGGFTGTAKNSIIYDNFPVNVDTNLGAGMNYCDTLPLPTSGAQNLTNVPLFVDAANGNFRLQPNSPCINAGYNAYATNFPDLEGNPRIVGGTVDIGAYEFQSPVSQISYAWLQQYGLPINGSTDSADTDGDGHNNWQEWRAGTIPTNAASVLKLFSPTGDVSGLTLRWQSVTTRTYWLERATNLPTFSTIATNLPGQSSTTAYLDSTATNAGAYFYRVGAKE
ncbi:MAG: hypothetical protein EPO07_01830 [Verrucomicrobia bacterium]|nr:MAG: hypothetical protein EPO07_01830 [Verrucomicrobiota bacterium]